MVSRTAPYVLVVLLAAGLIACGSGEPEISCGEGAQYDPEADECRLAEPDCEEGEEYVEAFNECARLEQEYCGDETEYDPDQGVCVATRDLECGSETVDEDGECIPAVDRSCGEGTVLYDGVCRPDEQVCGTGTEVDPDVEVVECVPTDEICGEGTEFDQLTRQCTSVSQLECGPGTVLVGDECTPAQSYYEELADDPDLDTTGTDEAGQIEVPGVGEQFVFVGNIDAPDQVDGEPVQDEDHYELDAEGGDWLELTVYSLGLPQPGFQFDLVDPDEGQPDFHRRSDLGAGLETVRQIAVPADGDYELTVGNLPQMRDVSPPAGGQDWNYVGVLEVMEAPLAHPVDIFDQTIFGDVRRLTTNYYEFDGMADVDSVQMLFDEVPEDAEAELQVWVDDQTLAETIAIDDDEIPFQPPSDTFRVLFDHVQATGLSTDYSVRGREATTIGAGEATELSHEFEAGEYIALSQYNTDGEAIEASILDEQNQPLAHTDELVMWNEQPRDRYLYAYSETDQTATIRLYNDTDADLESVAVAVDEYEADSMVVEDGGLQQLEFDDNLETGQRHYVEIALEYDDLLGLSLDDAVIGANAMTLLDENGQQVVRGDDELSILAEPGDYLLVVEAREAMPTGFTLTIEETDIFTVRETSEPEEPIPTHEEPVIDTIDIESCPTIEDIQVEVEIVHSYRGDLIVDVTAPNDETARIHEESGGLADDIIGAYPHPDDPDLEDGEALLDFVGTDGTGTWQIAIVDTWADTVSNGDLVSWTVQLTCEL